MAFPYFVDRNALLPVADICVKSVEGGGGRMALEQKFTVWKCESQRKHFQKVGWYTPLYLEFPLVGDTSV